MSQKLGLIGFVVLTIFIFGSFYLQLNESPSRTQSARLEPFGPISVHLATKPDPPKPGRIPLILHITDQNGKAVLVDQVQYEYSYKGQAAQRVDAKPDPDGSVQAIAQITDVGEWEVRVTLFMGGQQTQVTFKLLVGANI